MMSMRIVDKQIQNNILYTENLFYILLYSCIELRTTGQIHCAIAMLFLQYS